MSDAEDKYHPRSNPNLIGHDHAEEKFMSIWNSERIPHGWLLTGPRGIGKATLAFRIARFVLSNGGDQAASPGLFGESIDVSLSLDPESPVFRRISSGGHADLMTLERTINPDTNRLRSTIAVEEVRAAGDFLRLTASEGGWRVVIIDSVNELNTNSANALLKILEEPPDRALLLLVSHAPGRLLPTIRSRCCQMPLTPLSEADVLQMARTYNSELSESDLEVLCKLSDGSPGRALSLAEDGGLELYKELVSLIASLPNTETAELHKFGDKLARRGAEDKFRIVAELLAWWVSRLARLGARGTPIPNIVPEEQGCAARLLGAAGVDRLLEVWEKVNVLADQTDRLNLDRKQILLNMFHALKGASTN
ncbi:MAG: DNA polymerase III subunit delta' [Rhodospirillaceae bacterium]|nr:DNA polymerase III subunit delta' [Rhodospirillaceae bacterium]